MDFEKKKKLFSYIFKIGARFLSRTFSKLEHVFYFDVCTARITPSNRAGRHVFLNTNQFLHISGVSHQSEMCPRTITRTLDSFEKCVDSVENTNDGPSLTKTSFKANMAPPPHPLPEKQCFREMQRQSLDKSTKVWTNAAKYTVTLYVSSLLSSPIVLVCFCHIFEEKSFRLPFLITNNLFPWFYVRSASVRVLDYPYLPKIPFWPENRHHTLSPVLDLMFACIAEWYACMCCRTWRFWFLRHQSASSSNRLSKTNSTLLRLMNFPTRIICSERYQAGHLPTSILWYMMTKPCYGTFT